ncbi:ParB N-terminal domain-containing protein [Streptomyces xanthochromogenes]|uniref:Transcriptional regulator n=1 Tax=Streptomyces xanthochromogenes TaxID=67384 RepID=A0ABQ2ZP36_9ACTN|nr:hypothetical protein [Streptomyces xanthochromogenes]GGY21553.1 hypothetical protein GCM10010326_13070 [Streptomyces xanthochromogenes]
MFREFQAPPRADEFSELIKKRLEEVKSSGGTRETVTVEWSGQPLHVEVVDLPLDSLYFNPGTHRIRAQRSHDLAKDKALESDPWSAESQAYLKYLLQAEPAKPDMRDTAFDKLKESLEQFGQNDPGLVTHHGVLVNGNTRAAALRESGVQSMRVGVLPASFTWADINSVELSLQLRKDHRRDYSYINRLLAMEEQAQLGRTPEVIAKEFRIQPKTYHQERWILSTIRELIERSRNGSAALRLVDFEDDQEKLKELERLFKKLSTVEPDEAEVIKEWRLAAMLLDFAKTDVRHIDEHFVKADYLARSLPTTLASADAGAEAVMVPGLGVAVPGASSRVAAARALNDKILKAKALGAAKGPGVSDEDRQEARELFTEAREAFDRAIDDAGRDARVRKRKQLAPARLADACADIDQCVVELVQARTARSLDEDAFDEAVILLRASLSKLAQQAKRMKGEPGDGVSWLVEAVAAEAKE